MPFHKREVYIKMLILFLSCYVKNRRLELTNKLKVYDIAFECMFIM